MNTMNEYFRRGKPYLAVIFLQFGLAGMDIISKVALNEGMSNYVFVVYRHAVATLVIAPFAIILDKKQRPKMTLAIFAKLVLLSILEPVIDQNLYFIGMKYTTATFAAAMCNVLPAITFIMACIFRLEKVKIKSIRSQAKIFGTLATVAGAMMMTLLRGPIVQLFWTKSTSTHDHQTGVIDLAHSIKGALMITTGCFSWAFFMILQAITLRSYPTELSLTAWICLLGTANGGIVALVMERGNAAAWSINWDTKFLAALYSGVFCSGLAYYIQGVIMKDRGPVFVTAFNPLSMVIVAVMSTIILREQMFLGRVLGAAVIVIGLYMVLWGKSKDQNSTSSEQSLPEQQMKSANSEKENLPNEVITIYPSIEQSQQTVDKDKTVG
ncbi:PREDICTED: WAT1-related protein At2g37460 [Ipomoea nil]|uniref:WAT1-related protein At2g37460 n=1 Tax=Ipomoea nil TaxID=35883 RepID=UPI000900EB9E|nr:PREDICTED: WAT1-related protein At2g37460 [Ipomoea nil]